MIWTISGTRRLVAGGVSRAHRGRGWLLATLTCWHATLSSASPLEESSHGRGRPTASQAQKLETREAAFEQFFHAHEGTMLGYLWRITGDEQASHDIAQETFLRAWQRFDRVSRYDQPRAWLFRVATNLASNHRRHRSLHDAAMVRVHPDQPIAGDLATGIAESAAVRAVLLEMPIKQRGALVLRVVYGLSIPEIAEALATSRAAAAMTLSRARDVFRARYTQEESR